MGATSAAWAEDGQIRVNLAGVDLQTHAGAQVALARIRYQAAQFCEADAGRTTLDRTMASNRCVGVMTERAVNQLGAAQVTALYGARPVMAATRVLALAGK
jgi:UrcA family protein